MLVEWCGVTCTRGPHQLEGGQITHGQNCPPTTIERDVMQSSVRGSPPLEQMQWDFQVSSGHKPMVYGEAELSEGRCEEFQKAKQGVHKLRVPIFL